MRKLHGEVTIWMLGTVYYCSRRNEKRIGIRVENWNF